MPKRKEKAQSLLLFNVVGRRKEASKEQEYDTTFADYALKNSAKNSSRPTTTTFGKLILFSTL